MPFFKIRVPEIDYDAHVFYIEAKNEKEAEGKLEKERKSGRVELGFDIRGDSLYLRWDTEKVDFPIVDGR